MPTNRSIGMLEWPAEWLSILEPEALLDRFAYWVGAEVPFAAMRFFHHGAGVDAVFPAPGKAAGSLATSQYRVAEGVLSFMRSKPFSAGEKQRLSLFADSLLLPLNNALRYHQACAENRRLSERLLFRQALTSADPSDQDFERALLGDEFRVYYQPKVDLHSGEVIGLEALLRWKHAQKGLLPPDSFIPAAERSGMIRGVTRWVLNAVLRQCALWHQQGLLVPVAVNLSARDLADQALPDYLASLLDAWDLPPHAIELEITETAVIDDEPSSLAVINRLAALGMSVAVDDFGIGYSSLQRLRQLPVTIIKIDKSFVVDIARNDGDMVFVDAITRLGHKLGMKVVAEGVESLEGWTRLAEAGCDIGQGFHISRPLSEEAMTGWLLQAG